MEKQGTAETRQANRGTAALNQSKAQEKQGKAKARPRTNTDKQRKSKGKARNSKDYQGTAPTNKI